MRWDSAVYGLGDSEKQVTLQHPGVGVQGNRNPHHSKLYIQSPQIKGKPKLQHAESCAWADSGGTHDLGFRVSGSSRKVVLIKTLLRGWGLGVGKGSLRPKRAT